MGKDIIEALTIKASGVPIDGSDEPDGDILGQSEATNSSPTACPPEA